MTPGPSPEEVRHEYGIQLIEHPQGEYEGIILAVAHNQFTSLDITAHSTNDTVIFDLKSFLPKTSVDSRL